MDQKRYYVLDGELKANSSSIVPNVLLKSENDLEIIKDQVEPGTLAHLAEGNVTWELNAYREWIPVGDETDDGTDDSAGSDNVPVV